jgi:hypothetical protein
MRTLPVNQSAGPSPDGCEPIRLISIYQCDRLELHLRMSLACQAVALAKAGHASLITSSRPALLVRRSYGEGGCRKAVNHFF